MKWLEIGKVVRSEDKGGILLKLHEGYEKALNKLDLFSHCMLYFLTEERITVHVASIVEMREKEGEVCLEFAEVKTVLGQLVDIKPYFPAEEVIREAGQREGRYFLDYKGQVIGEYTQYGKRTVIRLDMEALSGKDVGYRPEAGDYVRVLWWFHRFDKDSFRRNRMCTPPYNNAPKTGIFATRSPVRPNPVGSTIVRLKKVDYENGILDVEGFDGFQGTKIFQIMIYQPSRDRIEGARVPPWVSHWTAYKRFVDPRVIDRARDRHERLEGEEPLRCSELEALEFEDEYDSNEIRVYNARIHNLKNISLSIPKNSINLITGVSGSGKSSLAFDTIYAESQKQFMDLVLSNQMMNDAFSDIHVDKITGLQPSIAIEQRTMAVNPRSTVGSVTKIAEVLRFLFANIGQRICPICHNVVDEGNVCSKCGQILFDISPQIFSYNHPDYMCPLCKGLGVEMAIDEEKIVEHPEKSLLDSASSLYGNLRKHRKKPNANWMRGEILALAEDLDTDLELPFSELPKDFRDQFFYGSNGREVSLAYKNANGRSGVITRPVEGAVNIVRRFAHDSKSSTAIDRVKKYMSRKTCSRCQGERILEEGRLVNILGYRYPELVGFSIDRLREWCHTTYSQLTPEDKEKTRMLFMKLNQRLKRIQDVGLSYITLDRSLPSLSGGEAQRLKLATQFGTGLSNILYIMDEPSKGLHPRDYGFLMDAITDLKNSGNTVILVEHKKSFLKIADMHIEMGPKAGRYGGEITSVMYGREIEDRLKSYDFGEDFDSIVVEGKAETGDFLRLKGATTNNLKSIDVAIPIGRMTAVIGVSGSGKTSLVSGTLYPALLKSLGKAVEEMGKHEDIRGAESFKDVSYVNQKPIGSNSRSNAATYTGVFDLIRQCYANTDQAREKNFTKDYFSFNSKKGQCESCKGLGEVAINMHYMNDLFVPCSKCHGKRYSKEVMEVKYKDLSIGDILEMETGDLREVFKDEDDIVEMLSMLEKVGLGYLKLGQSASTLSGGEAQRIKLAKELYNRDSSGNLYILDEPTTGLHEDDVVRIMDVLRELNEKGATIIVIEHNLKMIKACDYIVELGPVGGDEGGYVMKEGFQRKSIAGEDNHA